MGSKGSTTSTRRAALKAGGASLATIVGAMATGRVVLAAEATPAASPLTSPAADQGLEAKYVTVRSRTVAEGQDPTVVFSTILEGFVPIVRAIPGFVAYYGIAEPASRQTAFITICADKAGTDASTERAGAWLRDNGYSFFEGEPVVVEGPISVAAGALPAAPDGGGTATPAAGARAGDYVVVRSRKLKAERSGAELLGMIQEGFLPLVSGVPGFVAYLAIVNEETRDQFSVGIYADRAGAEATTAKAAEWGKQGAADFVVGDPIVITGAIDIAATASTS